MLLQIYGDIITDSDFFKNISPEVYIPLTRFIARNIDRKTHVPDVEKVVIVPSEDPVSRCYWRPSPNGGDGRFHVIQLHISNPDAAIRTLQWIQVFAHEYMHHAIDRKEKQFDPHPLVWFDETLCHISSVCIANDIYLELLHNKTSELQGIIGEKTSLSTIIGFPAQVAQNSPVAKSIRDGRGIRKFLPFPEDGLDLARDSFAIASCAQNLFLKNPNLWKIVPRINEIPIDSDIDSLFLHLEKTAEASYKSSLEELKNLLLPY